MKGTPAITTTNTTATTTAAGVIICISETASGSIVMYPAAARMHSFPIIVLQHKATVFLSVKWYIVTANAHGCDTLIRF
jgi:hypothetical protein